MGVSLFQDPLQAAAKQKPDEDRYEWGGQGREFSERRLEQGLSSGYVPGTSGAERDAAIYESRALQSQDRKGAQIDQTQSNQARDAQNYALGQTNDAMGLARNAAYGNAPSAAEIYGQRMLDDSINSQMAMAASASGGPSSIASAQRQAAFQGAQTQQAGARDLAAMRANEMASARDQYLGAAGAYAGQAGAMRGQDIGVATSQAGFNDANQNRNQQNAQYYDQLAWNTNKQAQDSAIERQRMENEYALKEQSLRQEKNRDDWGIIKDVGGTIGSVVGSFASDERAKENISSIGPAAPDETSGIGAMFSKGGGARSSYMPTMLSDMRSKDVYVSARANGGPVTGGQPYLVGERGPELVVPESSGYVIPNEIVALSDSPDGELRQTDDGRAYYQPRLEAPEPHPAFASKSSSSRGEARAEPKAKVRQISVDELSRMADQMKADMGADHERRMADGPAARRLASGSRETGYTTELTKGGEQAFQRWHDKTSPQDSGNDYDLRGAFADGTDRDGRGHLPDTYKKPNHETFSDESVYAREAPESAGHWDGERYSPKGPPAWLRSEMEDPMADANRAQSGSIYSYKPEFAAGQGQAPGEMNVGPMAQTMAADPLASSAVAQDPQTGMLQLDRDKLSKLQSAGIASLQRQVDNIYAGGR